MHGFKIWFDGGCKPNPGIGYGSVEISGDSSPYKVRVLEQRFGEMTSNLAEYKTLEKALTYLVLDSKSEQVKALGDHVIPSARMTLKIESDSRLLVEQLNGRWKCKNAPIRNAIEEVRALLREFGHWKLTWKPRRNNVERFGH